MSADPLFGPVFQFCERDDIRPDWVEVDVVQLSACQGADGIVIGAETGLEDVSDGSPEGLMLVGEGGLQRMHALTQVTERGGHHQVEVVSHNRIGVQLPAEAECHREDGLKEDLLGRIGLEDRSPQLRPIVGMVGALVGEQSSTSGHCRTVTA